MKISGKWIGYYEYGSGYELPHFGERVKITANLEELAGEINGVMNEEGEKSVPLEATIHGFIEDGFVSFTKTYPVQPEINEDGELEFNESQELEIDYIGIIDPDYSSMYGKWVIQMEFVDEDGNLFSNINEGIWLLQKV